MSDKDRVEKSTRMYRRNLARHYRKVTGQSRMSPTELFFPEIGSDLSEDVNATMDEMMAYLIHENRVLNSELMGLQKAASIGLGVELGGHEFNSETSSVIYNLKSLLENEALDTGPRRDAQRALDAISRLHSSFHYYKGQRSGYSLFETGNDLVSYFSGGAFSRYSIEFTKAFREARLYMRSQNVTVFQNLFSNAIILAQNAGTVPKIKVDAYEVVLYPGDPDAEDEDDREPTYTTIVSIGDNGPGVDQKMREVLFRPYQSGRGSSGLGLYLCRQVLRNSFDTIVLNDEPSALGGAEFLIGRSDILEPVDKHELTVREHMLIGAVGMAHMLSADRASEVLRTYADDYAELMTEALRIRVEGPQDNVDKRLALAAEIVEGLLRGDEGYREKLDEEFGEAETLGKVAK